MAYRNTHVQNTKDASAGIVFSDLSVYGGYTVSG